MPWFFMWHCSLFILFLATTLSGCDWPSHSQPGFLIYKQSRVKRRKVCRIRCLPDQSLPDPPVGSFRQQALMFLLCAGCKVSRCFTLLSLGGMDSCTSGLVWLNFKFCARSVCVTVFYGSWLIFRMLRNRLDLTTSCQINASDNYAIHENALIKPRFQFPW